MYYVFSLDVFAFIMAVLGAVQTLRNVSKGVGGSKGETTPPFLYFKMANCTFYRVFGKNILILSVL